MDPIQAIITACERIASVSPWLLFIPHAGAACMIAYAVWITFRSK